MINVNLKQLEAFVITVEYNSFTRAAEQLYLTQSTISAHIARLEQALGVQLFRRRAKKNICLTDEGKALYLRAKEILNRCDELQSLGDTPNGRLLLGASTVPAQNLLPEIMSDFRKKHSDCSFILRRGDSQKVHELLKSGEIKLGFVGAAQDARVYQYHTLLEDELVLVTAANSRYRKMWNKMLPGRELLSEPMILREESSGTLLALQAYLKHICFAKGDMQVVARSDNPEAIKSMVASGMGASVLSALAVRDEVTSGRLLSFPLDSDGLYRKIYVAYRRDAQLTALEKEFVAFARKQAKKELLLH